MKIDFYVDLCGYMFNANGQLSQDVDARTKPFSKTATDQRYKFTVEFPDIFNPTADLGTVKAEEVKTEEQSNG